MHWTQNPKWEEKRKEWKLKLKNRKPNAGSFKKGIKNPLKGKKLPWADKAAEGRMISGMYENKKPHAGDFKKGSTPWNFKEKGVGMVALHSWVKRRLGRPMMCEKCGYIATSYHKIHWSNISHEYKRDIRDWQRLCVPCHKRYDLDFKKNQLSTFS